jgi:predicted protein tyrosine phosphatase
MKVDIYTREKACALEPVEGTVVISISYPEEDAPLQEGWEAVLWLRFHEASRRCDTLMKGPILFNEGMAKRVEEFVQTHKNKNFVIHCHSGQRRSVAIALYLKHIFGAEVEAHIGHQPDWRGAKNNTLEYRLLMELPT